MKNEMNVKANQEGFTLIELVVVIVILGILAVTAAPKFIDLQGDAKGATLQGVKAALETANAGVHAKSLIKGNNLVIKANNPTITLNEATVEIGSGWALATVDNVTDILDISANDFDRVVGSSNNLVISPKLDTAKTAAEALTAECYVQYIESTNSNTKPEITAVVTKC